MLQYQAAFDIYHTIYRIILILSKYNEGDIVEIDRIRIFDYYVLFPQRISKISFPRNEYDKKKVLFKYKSKANKYEDIIDDCKMFERLRPYQMSAFKQLAAKEIIEIEDLERGNIRIKNKKSFPSIIDEKDIVCVHQINIVSALRFCFLTIPLANLKERTHLMEYRYVL